MVAGLSIPGSPYPVLLLLQSGFALDVSWVKHLEGLSKTYWTHLMEMGCHCSGQKDQIEISRSDVRMEEQKCSKILHGTMNGLG